MGHGRQAIIIPVGNHRKQRLYPLYPRRGDDAKLGDMGADGVDQHGPLANPQLPCAVQHQNALLPHILHCHKTHGGAGHRFTYGLCIHRVVLIAIHVGLYLARRHQPDLMVQPADLPGPVMRRGRGRHAHQTAGLLGEERHHLSPARLPADNDFSVPVNVMNLKNGLRQINTDRDTFLNGRLLFPRR